MKARFFFFLIHFLISPGGAEVKASACNVGDLGSRPGFDPLVRKIPWRRKWQPTPVFLPGESHGQRSLVDYSPRVTNSQTRLSNFTHFTYENLGNSILRGSDGKEIVCNAGDLGSIPGSGRSPGEGNGKPLQYSCLQNPMDRGAWWTTVHRSQRVGHD